MEVINRWTTACPLTFVMKLINQLFAAVRPSAFTTCDLIQLQASIFCAVADGFYETFYEYWLMLINNVPGFSFLNICHSQYRHQK
jgi:nucleoside recognition membrane protein YjiH